MKRLSQKVGDLLALFGFVPCQCFRSDGVFQSPVLLHVAPERRCSPSGECQGCEEPADKQDAVSPDQLAQQVKPGRRAGEHRFIAQLPLDICREGCRALVAARTFLIEGFQDDPIQIAAEFLDEFSRVGLSPFGHRAGDHFVGKIRDENTRAGGFLFPDGP